MDQPQYTTLLEALRAVPDPRHARSNQFFILAVIASALVSQQRRVAAIAQWATSHATTLVDTFQPHGRLEERRITVSSWVQDYSDWPYLAQVFKLERIFWRAGTSTTEVRYGVTRLPAAVADAARLLTLARAEWGIENGLHYRRDVSLAEDASRLRRGHGPQAMAALNNAVIGLVLLAGERNLAAIQRTFAYRFDRWLARQACP